jgi:hypothetical protein
LVTANTTTSKLDDTTISRMESSGGGKVRALFRNITRVVQVLKTRGIEITETGVHLVRKPRR